MTARSVGYVKCNASSKADSGQWYISDAEGYGDEFYQIHYLHRDGEWRTSTQLNGEWMGYYSTKQDALNMCQKHGITVGNKAI